MSSFLSYFFLLNIIIFPYKLHKRLFIYLFIYFILMVLGLELRVYTLSTPSTLFY
jgi:uncharacterized protein YhhL (DUF1145 family)